MKVRTYEDILLYAFENLGHVVVSKMSLYEVVTWYNNYN